MTRYLELQITFYEPRYHGRLGPTEPPEWPPSPFRLFQALLAGAATCGGLGDEHRRALEWLERQGPPLILAPVPAGSSQWLRFVPPNQDEHLDQKKSLTGKMAFYYFFSSESPKVSYLWPWNEDCPYQALEDLAKHLHTLGWGVDAACAQLATREGDPQPADGRVLWRPCSGENSPHTLLRVPTSGSLADLEKAFHSWAKRLVTPRLLRYPYRARIYELHMYLPHTRIPGRPWAAFRLPESLAFGQVNIARVAAMLRSLTIRLAAADGLPNTEEYVAGHVGSAPRTPPRFSYLPLPSVGHPKTDGMIRRCAVVEPFGGEGTMAAWAQEALHNQLLKDEHGNLLGRLGSLPASDNVFARYLGPSRYWLSVTPVLLPGFDDRKYAKALTLFRQALEQADLPEKAVEDVILQKAPFWSGSLHPMQYFRPTYLRRFPGWHAKIIFTEPVKGPLALGAGRHVGLGLFACPSVL